MTFWTRVLVTQCCLQILIRTSWSSGVDETISKTLPQVDGLLEVELVDATPSLDETNLEKDEDGDNASTPTTSSSPSSSSSSSSDASDSSCGCSKTNRQTKEKTSDLETCSLEDETQTTSHLFEKEKNAVDDKGKCHENLANLDSNPTTVSSSPSAASSSSATTEIPFSSPTSSTAPESSSSSSSSSSPPSSPSPSSSFRDLKRAHSVLKTLNPMKCLLAGKFKMGTDRPVILTDGESPSRSVTVDPFCIDAQVNFKKK